MKITICGSIAFIDEMQAAQKQLEGIGHEVKMPPTEIIDDQGEAIPAKQYYELRKSILSSVDDSVIRDDPRIDSCESAFAWVWDRKEKAMRLHFDKVVWSDAILVLNHRKNDIDHYIGANTLLEMGLAFHFGKKIYLLNPIPEISCKEEVLGMRPIVCNGNLSLIG